MTRAEVYRFLTWFLILPLSRCRDKRDCVPTYRTVYLVDALIKVSQGTHDDSIKPEKQMGQSLQGWCNKSECKSDKGSRGGPRL